MTKKVIVSISGLQFNGESEGDNVEVITTGDYYYRNGNHYIIYDEVMEGFPGITKNTIKFKDDVLDITKKGVTNVHMIFEENKKNMTYYNTPFGNLLIGLASKNIDVQETEHDIVVKVDYALEVNYEYLADCSIKMNIKSSEAKDFHFQ